MKRIKKLHARLIVSGLYKQPLPTSNVLAAYAQSTSQLRDAGQVFDHRHNPSISICNTIIRALTQIPSPSSALLFYARMHSGGWPHNAYTFPCVLSACTNMSEIRVGTTVHAISLKAGMVVDVWISNALLQLYGSCGELGCARMVFDEMTVRDLVSWNTLICGLSQKGCLREVLDVFKEMESENVVADAWTMVKAVSACSRLGEWELAESMVRYMEENGVDIDVYLGNSLMDLCRRRGLTELAERVFSGMKVRDTKTCNIMMTVYAKAGNMAAARKIFDGMAERDLVSWSCMITGYSQAKQFLDTLLLFREMQNAEVRADKIVLVSVLSACAKLRLLLIGKWIHKYIRKNNIELESYVGNSLIDMYAKCGCLGEALKVFKEMKEMDRVSWNSIIIGLARNGCVETAFEVFSQMTREGFEPNGVTILGVLNACAYNGLVDKALEVFNTMKEVYQVEPTMSHYSCVIRLLARAGELEKAHKFITDMPVKPDLNMWRIILDGCKWHGNASLAEIATKEFCALIFSDLYTSADDSKVIMKVRKVTIERNAKNQPDSSLTEVGYTGE